MIGVVEAGEPGRAGDVRDSSWPSPEITMSTSAVRSGTLSGLLSSSFSPTRRRKLSVQRRWMWACSSPGRSPPGRAAAAPAAARAACRPGAWRPRRQGRGRRRGPARSKRRSGDSWFLVHWARVEFRELWQIISSAARHGSLIPFLISWYAGRMRTVQARLLVVSCALAAAVGRLRAQAADGGRFGAKALQRRGLLYGGDAQQPARRQPDAAGFPDLRG